MGAVATWGSTDGAGQAAPGRGSIKLSSFFEWGPVCGHWTLLGPKSQVCSSTTELPRPPPAGKVAPGSPQPSAERDQAQNLASSPTPSGAFPAVGPGCLGMMVPETPPPSPRPWTSQAQRAPTPVMGVPRMTDPGRSSVPEIHPLIIWVPRKPTPQATGGCRTMTGQLSTPHPLPTGWQGRKDKQLL